MDRMGLRVAQLKLNVLALLMVAGVARAQECPYTQAAITVDPEYRGFAVADLDGQNGPDIALALVPGAGGPVVLWNRGDGSFSAPNAADAGDVFAVLAVDIDGRDGPDLVMANYPDSVSVHRNAGNGSFLPESRYTTAWSPAFLDSADLDGRNGIDIIVLENTTSFRVLFNDGTGSLLPPVTHALTDVPSRIAISDLDGKNGPDVALTYARAAVAPIGLFLNQGDGSFAPEQRMPIASYVRGIVAIDVDGVSGADLVVTATDRDEVATFMNRGDGTFLPPWTTPVGQSPMDIASLDLDGRDGPDLVVLNSVSEDVSVLLNDGAAGFLPEERHTAGAPFALAIAQIDGRNGPDLVVAGNGFLALLIDLGGGALGSHARVPTGLGPSAPIAQDVDGDAIPDLVVTNRGDGDISILHGAGDGTFPSTRRVAVGTNLERVVAADFDGVNGIDLAGTVPGIFPNSDLIVLLSDGAGGFATPVAYALGGAARVLAVADLDRRNGPDVVIGFVFDSELVVLRNQGNGTFLLSRLPSVWYPLALTTADLDGRDGPDVLVLGISDNSYTAPLGVLFNDGLGGLSAPRVQVVGGDPYAVAVGDIDGLPGTDVAITKSRTDEVGVLYNAGDGTFSGERRYGVSDLPREILVVDVDGRDGPDLLTTNQGGVLSYLQNRGDGTFYAARHFALGASTSGLASADFDSDGTADVAASGRQQGIHILFHCADCDAAAIPEVPRMLAAKDPDRRSPRLVWDPVAEANDGYRVSYVADARQLPACAGCPGSVAVPDCSPTGSRFATQCTHVWPGAIEPPIRFYQVRGVCGSSEGPR